MCETQSFTDPHPYIFYHISTLSTVVSLIMRDQMNRLKL